MLVQPRARALFPRRRRGYLTTISRATFRSPSLAPASPISAPVLIAGGGTALRSCTTRSLSPKLHCWVKPSADRTLTVLASAAVTVPRCGPISVVFGFGKATSR